ncbi:unnamed protein product [Sphagnum balticum]
MVCPSLSPRVGDQGVAEYGLPENFGLKCGLGLFEAGPHVHPSSKNAFPKRMGDFLELWGGQEPIDIMVPWIFSVD